MSSAALGGVPLPRRAAALQQQQQQQQQQHGHSRLHHLRRRQRVACAPPRAAAAAAAVDAPPGLAAAKARLLAAGARALRGGAAGRALRGEVEEAQVAVEAFAGSEADFSLLAGLWRLEYTTAADVVPIVRPPAPGALSSLLPLRFGRVFQRFSAPAEGRVQNVIEARLALPFLDDSRVDFIVEAAYEVRTLRSIRLTFREAGFGDVRLGAGLQNLLASPLLPRGWLQQRLLLALQEASLRVPLATPSAAAGGRGGTYRLTYLDGDMLIGRAQGSGGSFVFCRQAEEDRLQGDGGGGGDAL